MFLSLSLSHLTTRDDAWWSSESNLTFTRNQHICKKEFIWFNRNCISHFDFFRSRLNSSSIDALLVAVIIQNILLFEKFECDPAGEIRIESNGIMWFNHQIYVCLTLVSRKKIIRIEIGCLYISLGLFSRFIGQRPMRHYWLPNIVESPEKAHPILFPFFALFRIDNWSSPLFTAVHNSFHNK